MIKTLHNDTLKKIYLYLIGFLWISLFIFMRFLRQRSGFELNTLKSNITPLIIYSNIGFIILHITLILLSIYLILQAKKELFKNNLLIEDFKRILNILIIQPLESIRDLIAPHIPGSGLFFCKVADFIEKNVEIRSKILVIFFDILPRIIIAIIFFVEIVIYNKIEFFLYSLFLFIIPLTWLLFVNLFTNFGKKSIQDIQRNVKVVGVGEPEANGWYTSYQILPLPQFSYEPDELKSWADTWSKVLIIYSVGQTFFKDFKRKIIPYVTILTSSLYLLASIYQLTFILF